MVAKGQYHHGNLREALVDAAVRLVELKGVEGLSLRAVAREAGVSQAAPYHHFKDKEALLAEVCHLGFVDLVARMRAAIESQPDALAQLDALARVYVEFGMERRAFFRIMWGNHIEDKNQYSDLKCVAMESFELLLLVIVSGQQAGVIREGNPAELGSAAWAAVHGAARLIVDKGFDTEEFVQMGLTAERLVHAVSETVRRGLAATDPP